MKPHEDWVYESWTVDCVCGVDFDDGKEMVDCDECGVWVHTWCSRYVKGDDLFVCHKCKIENNDSKITMRMVNSSNQTHTVPLKSCSDIPIEERVHEQGIPGGDLALFERFSSVFSRQLWKCTGYVPKKFRLKYREFPCWADKENVCQIGDQEDTCVGVLVSMSKGDNVDSKGTNDEKLKEIRNWGSREFEMKSSQSELKKEKRLLSPLITNKGRRESQVACEERVKKKIKVADKEDEDDKKGLVGKSCYFSSLTATKRLRNCESCRCRMRTTTSGGGQSHTVCPCGEHCGCNPCTCPKTQTSAKGCTCSDACTLQLAPVPLAPLRPP